MGDIIHSLPAVAALRRALPAAQIDWIVEERWAELLCSRADLRRATGDPRERPPERPLVDRALAVDTRAWRRAPLTSATRAEARAMLWAMRAPHYELTLDLQSAVKSALLARFARAPFRYGFARPIEWPASFFYTHEAEAQGTHVAEQNVALALAALR